MSVLEVHNSVILAVETATMTNTAAILRGGELLAEFTVNAGRRHAERLLSLIDALLRETGLTLAQIDAFAVSIGPGSFTGLRIGVATLKGLAFAGGKPLVPVPTLRAMAQAMPPFPGLICPVLDARMGEIYGAAYRQGPDGLVELEGPVVASMEGFLALALTHRNSGTERMLLFGDALAPYEAQARAAASHLDFAPDLYAAPRAAGVGLLALRMLQDGCGSDAALAAPIYLRKSQAELSKERGVTASPGL